MCMYVCIYIPLLMEMMHLDQLKVNKSILYKHYDADDMYLL